MQAFTNAVSRIVHHPVWLFLVGLATIGAAVIAIPIWSDRDSPPPQADPRVKGVEPSVNVAPSAGSTERDAARTSPTGHGVGTCLSASQTPAPCDTAHTYEVIASGPCSQQLLVSYLGGVSNIDVLGNQLRSESLVLQGARTCALRSAGGATMNSSVRNALASSRGDVLRRCIDGRKEVYVSCSEPHTSEVVYVYSSPDSTELNCPAKAARYMGVDPIQLANDLKVTLLEPKGRSPECHVVVAGRNVFTGSLRSIGTQALPISPAP